MFSFLRLYWKMKKLSMCYCLMKSLCLQFHLYCCLSKNQKNCSNFNYLTVTKQLNYFVQLFKITVQLVQFTDLNFMLHSINLKILLLLPMRLGMQITAKLPSITPPMQNTEHTINCKYYSLKHSNSSFSSEGSPCKIILHNWNTAQSLHFKIQLA